MARVYLETSFFSACASDRADAASVYRRERGREWWTTQRDLHALFISPEVLIELAEPHYRHRDEALAMTAGIGVLAIAEDVRGLARARVRERAMPGPEESGDAVHVAVATVHGLDFVLSWNVRHLANLNKVEHLRAICRRMGYVPPVITTPENLWQA